MSGHIFRKIIINIGNILLITGQDDISMPIVRFWGMSDEPLSPAIMLMSDI